MCLCILRNPAVFDSITCQFLYRNYHSITKKNRAISCHSLFPAWECKQTWLLLNFVPTIDFTSSQFPSFEKRQNCQFWLFGRNLPKKDFSSLKQKKWTAPLNSAYSNYSWYQISAETNKFDFFWTKFAQKGCFRSKTEKVSTNCYQFKNVENSKVVLSDVRKMTNPAITEPSTSMISVTVTAVFKETTMWCVARFGTICTM